MTAIQILTKAYQDDVKNEERKALLSIEQQGDYIMVVWVSTDGDKVQTRYDIDGAFLGFQTLEKGVTES